MTVTLDDRELVAEIRQGDMQAFENLFNKYKNSIFRTALALTRDPGMAEEILQDCFYRAYKHIDTASAEPTLAPWLHKIAVNLSYNRLKKKRFNLVPFESVLDYFIPDHYQANLAERSEIRAVVREAVEELSTKHRVVVILHYLEDFTPQEIAYIIDCPLGTVRSRLHYARKVLKDKLWGYYASEEKEVGFRPSTTWQPAE